ncbi:MAG: hypothetical protein WCG08_10195 [Paludibacter sp.]
MRKLSEIVLYIFLVVGFYGCNNDFLNSNFSLIFKNTLVSSDSLTLYYNQTTGSYTMTVKNAGETAAYRIRKYPDNIQFNSLKGNLQNNVLALNFICTNRFTDPSFDPTKLGEIVVEVEDFGYVIIPVNYFFTGGAELKINKTLIDFGTTGTLDSVEIATVWMTKLIYKIIEIPDWISINDSDKSGGLSFYAKKQIKITCDRTGKPGGLYEGNIVVQTNDPNQLFLNITVKMRPLINPDELQPIEGTVADCEYIKSENKLFIATKSPDRVLIISTDNGTKQQIDLNHSPNCISLSEDGQQLFVCSNGYVDKIIINSLSIAKSYTVKVNVGDIVYGENNYCYLIVKNESEFSTTSNAAFRYFNMSDGILFTAQNYDIYTGSNILKLKGKPYLIGTRPYTSPNGVALFSINDIPIKISYWHDSFGARLWPSENGILLFGTNSSIIQAPDNSTGTSITSYGKLTDGINSYSYNLGWIDLCPNTKSIWAIRPDYTKTDYSDIVEYDDTNYKQKRVLIYSTDYLTTINGINAFYKTVPYFLFSNKTGTKLFAIMNLGKSYNANQWSIQTINLAK